MSQIRLYMDEDSMSQALVRTLRNREIDVVTVNDTRTAGTSDLGQLRLATLQGRVIFSHNIADFCKLHADFIASGEVHAGIALLPQGFSIGERLKAILGLKAKKSSEDMQGQLAFLSLYLRDC